MKIHTNTLPEEVSDAFCDPIQQPPDVNACHVACPGSCVLSPWSDWSDCSKVVYQALNIIVVLKFNFFIK